MAPVACLLCPLACLLCPLACCVLPCALCCPPAAGDETGAYYQRRVFVTSTRGPVYVARGVRTCDPEVFIVNSTVFEPRARPVAAQPPVLIEEVEEEPEVKRKTQ